MPQPGYHQHQGGTAVREVANHPGPSRDLPVQPLQGIVGSDPDPVSPWEVHVGQRFIDAFPQSLGRSAQAHVNQVGRHLFGLFLGRLPVLLGMNRLEHGSHLGHLFPRHLRQDVPVKMEHASLPLRPGKTLRHRFHQSQALVAHHQTDSRQASADQMPKELQPTLLVLLYAFENSNDFTVSVGIHADRHQQRHLADFTTPSPLQPNPVQVQVRMLPLDPLVPPGFNLPVYLLILFADCGRTYPHPPKGFRDVLHASDADSGQVHLDQRLFHAGFQTLVPLYDLSLKWQRPQTRHLQGDFPGLVCNLRVYRFGMQLTGISARSGIHTIRASLVPLGPAKLLGLLIQELL